MGFVITGVAAANMVINVLVGQTSDILGVAAGYGSFMIFMLLALALMAILDRRLTVAGG